jgi:hypothetical protein
MVKGKYVFYEKIWWHSLKGDSSKFGIKMTTTKQIRRGKKGLLDLASFRYNNILRTSYYT